MNIYSNICYKVEDVFVKILTTKQDSKKTATSVSNYRQKKEEEKAAKKKEVQHKVAERKVQREFKQMTDQQKTIELEKIKKLKIQQEREIISPLLSKLVCAEGTNYEFANVKKDKKFFQNVVDRVFESNEQGLSFILCEFDKTNSTEIRGYLFATNKRLIFVNENLNFQQNFRYQAINDVQWFKDGAFERGLKISYGLKKTKELEFDEIFDTEQMKHLGNLILQKSAKNSDSIINY